MEFVRDYPREFGCRVFYLLTAHTQPSRGRYVPEQEKKKKYVYLKYISSSELSMKEGKSGVPTRESVLK